MAGAEIFVIFTMFSSALRPAEPPIQWVIGGFPGGKSIYGIQLAILFHLVLWFKNTCSCTSVVPIFPYGMVCT